MLILKKKKTLFIYKENKDLEMMMFNRGQRGVEPVSSNEPEIRLVNMKTEDYEEFRPIYQNNNSVRSSAYQNDTFKEMVREKFNNEALPLSMRKRIMYEKIKEKQYLEEMKLNDENIFDYLKLSSNITDIPIVMRKHLLSEKIKNGVNCS